MKTRSQKSACGVSKEGWGVGGGCSLMAPPSDATCSLDSLSENKIGDEGVELLSATFPQLKALETLK